jgi:hypothetical protein
MDPFLKRSLFRANRLIYFSNPNNLYESPNEYTGKLIVIKGVTDRQGRKYIFCRPLSRPFIRIYVFKTHFDSYIVDGTLQFIRKIL